MIVGEIGKLSDKIEWILEKISLIAKAAISVEVPMYTCVYMYVHVCTIIQREQTQSFLQKKAYLCDI